MAGLYRSRSFLSREIRQSLLDYPVALHDHACSRSPAHFQAPNTRLEERADYHIIPNRAYTLGQSDYTNSAGYRESHEQIASGEVLKRVIKPNRAAIEKPARTIVEQRDEVVQSYTKEENHAQSHQWKATVRPVRQAEER